VRHLRRRRRLIAVAAIAEVAVAHPFLVALPCLCRRRHRLAEDHQAAFSGSGEYLLALPAFEERGLSAR
jgi:hypothetical protein